MDEDSGLSAIFASLQLQAIYTRFTGNRLARFLPLAAAGLAHAELASSGRDRRNQQKESAREGRNEPRLEFMPRTIGSRAQAHGKSFPRYSRGPLVCPARHRRTAGLADRIWRD